MKKTHFVLLIFSALLVVLPGCKKKLFDHRNKYMGDYIFTYSYHYFHGGTLIDTSIFYSGSIDYGSKGEIRLSWVDGTDKTLGVVKNGVLTRCNKKVGNINDSHIGFSYDENVCEPLLGISGYIHSLSGDKL